MRPTCLFGAMKVDHTYKTLELPYRPKRLNEIQTHCKIICSVPIHCGLQKYNFLVWMKMAAEMYNNEVKKKNTNETSIANLKKSV